MESSLIEQSWFLRRVKIMHVLLDPELLILLLIHPQYLAFSAIQILLINGWNFEKRTEVRSTRNHRHIFFTGYRQKNTGKLHPKTFFWNNLEIDTFNCHQQTTTKWIITNGFFFVGNRKSGMFLIFYFFSQSHLKPHPVCLLEKFLERRKKNHETKTVRLC